MVIKFEIIFKYLRLLLIFIHYYFLILFAFSTFHTLQNNHLNPLFHKIISFGYKNFFCPTIMATVFLFIYKTLALIYDNREILKENIINYYLLYYNNINISFTFVYLTILSTSITFKLNIKCLFFSIKNNSSDLLEVPLPRLESFV